MRKSSPRLLAGLVALGLFAVVGTFTVRAFATPAAPVSAPQASTETSSDIKNSMWQETRGGTSSK